MNICPQCAKPCMPAELHAYGKCEDCYNPSPAALTGFPSGVPVADRPGQKPDLECGGGRRVIRSPRGLA